MRAEDIEAAYQLRLTLHPLARWGWSFMYTPEAALSYAKVVLIGLNPGGKQEDPPQSWEHTGVNAFVDDPWGNNKEPNPLQVQVGQLFSSLGVLPNEVFAANLVPFRSPSWKDLPDKKGALVFGRSIWTDLLKRTHTRLFVSIGKQSGQELATLLGATSVQHHEVEWKNQRIDEYGAQDGRTVLALPHLSRFRVFGSKRTAAAAAVSKVAKRVLI